MNRAATRSASARNGLELPGPVQRVWYNLVKRSLQLGWTLCYKVRCTGHMNVPREGPVLLVSNHQSHFDPPLVGGCCPRAVSYMARETLFKSPLFGGLIRSLNAFPIDRDGSGIAGIKETLRRLKRGEAVLVFPEGTRSPDGQIAPFKPGFASLAVRSQATVVPVGLAGAYQAWPRKRNLPGPGRLYLHYGRPMPPDELAGATERELVARIEAEVRACFALVEARRLAAARKAGGSIAPSE
ncbi:MAG: 1-acyl-sn-glycerol-3-phosphate acyltransferase [Pirellulales bacterium]|nr:1-acyl-sn-glycerol-3-phosphate acyltransferase [Pirellulales bacterium]